MFKDLRPNNPLYILRKGEVPTLEVGTVQTVTPPVPKIQQNFSNIPQQPEYVVDVTVKSGNETGKFEKLPATMAIAEFQNNGSPGIVVACSRDLIRNELESMLSLSRGVIESVSYHQNVIAQCEELLQGMNPALAKEKQQEKRIEELTAELSEVKSKLNGIDDLKTMLAGLVADKGERTNTNQQHFNKK